MTQEPTNPGDLARFLTKREHFAAIAMQGILANQTFANYSDEQIANISINLADQLINQLNKKP